MADAPRRPIERFPEANLVRIRHRRIQEDGTLAWAETLGPNTYRRMAASWRLMESHPDTHLAFAQAGVEVDDGVWPVYQATRQLMRAEQGTIGGELVIPGMSPQGTASMFGGQRWGGGFQDLDDDTNDQLMQFARAYEESGAGTQQELLQAVQEGRVPLEDILEANATYQEQQVAQLQQPDQSALATTGGGIAGFLGTSASIITSGLSSNPIVKNTVGRAVDLVRDNPVSDNVFEPIMERVKGNAIVDDIIEPAVNVGVTMLDTPYQLTQAGFRDYVNRVREDGFVGGTLGPAQIVGDVVQGDWRGAKQQLAEEFVNAQQGVASTSIGTMALDIAEELPPGLRSALSFGATPSDGGQVRFDEWNGQRITWRPGIMPEVGEGINIGEGFFFGGKGEEYRLGVEQTWAPRINGPGGRSQTVTIGRWTAQPLDQGSFEQQVVSGLIDGGIAVFGPGELAIDSLARGARGGGAFMTLQPTGNEVRMADAIAATDDVDEIRRLVPNISDEVAERLAATGTAGDVRGVVFEISDADISRLAAAETADEAREVIPNLSNRGAEALIAADSDDAVRAVISEGGATTWTPGVRSVADRVGLEADSTLDAPGGTRLGTSRRVPDSYDAVEPLPATGPAELDTAIEARGRMVAQDGVEVGPEFTQASRGIVPRGFLDSTVEVGNGTVNRVRDMYQNLSGSNLQFVPDTQAIAKYTESEEFTRLLTHHVENGSGIRQLDQLTGQVVDPTVLRQMDEAVKAGDVEGLRALMQSQFGLTVRGNRQSILSRALEGLPGPQQGRRPLDSGLRNAGNRWDAVRDTIPTVARLRAQVPGTQFTLDNPRRLMDEVETFLINTNAPSNLLDRWVARAAAVEGRPDAFNMLQEMMREVNVRGFLRSAPPRVRGVADDFLAPGSKFKLGDDFRASIDTHIRENGLNIDVDEAYEAALQGAPTGIDELDRVVKEADRFFHQHTEMLRGHQDAQSAFNANLISGPETRGEFEELLVNGEDVVKLQNEPHLLNEYIGRTVPQPDPVLLRREFARFRGLYLSANDDLRLGVKILDSAIWLQNRAWKPLTLLRLAWPLRVVGEEQLRLAASGRPSMFTHPIQHIALMMGGGGRRGKLTNDALGEVWSELDEFGQALNRSVISSRGGAGQLMGGLTGRNETGSFWSALKGQRPPARHASFYTVARADELKPQQAAAAWADELGRLAYDPTGRVILNSGSMDEAFEVFWEGNARQIREQLIAANPRGVYGFDLSTREGAMDYLRSVDARIHDATGGNGELMQAMRDRSLNGHKIGDGSGFSAGFLRELDARREWMPENLRIPDARLIDNDSQSYAVEWMFSMLMSEPTNRLSRSPVFRQSYWEKIVEFAPRLNADQADILMDAARAANLPKDQMRALKTTIGQATSGTPAGAVGSLTAVELDHVAKGHALQHTQDLLFDVTRRNQFFDAMALVFPFGDAWGEVMTRWATLLRQNPNAVRRASQAIEWGREQGFLTTDPNGDEWFTYPASEFVSSLIPGAANIPLRGRLDGLSLATDVLPGIGPVMNIPVSLAMPESSDWDWLREILLPYGGFDEDENWFAEAYGQFTPPWLRRLVTGVSGAPLTEAERRSYASSFGSVMGNLLSTGNYNVWSTNPDLNAEEWTRLIEDSHRANGRGWAIRGAAAWLLPAAPYPDYYVENPVEGGERLHLDYLRELWGEIPWGEDDQDLEIQRFMETYGPGALLSVQGRTVSTVHGNVPTTAEADAWFRDNSGFVDDHNLVAHLFAPQDGTFDFEARNRVMEAGLRVPLTEDQQVIKFHESMADIEYSAEVERLEATLREQGWDGGDYPREARVHLQNYDDWLTEVLPRYSGRDFGQTNGLPGKVSRTSSMNELRRAIDDPTVADHPITEPTRAMFEAWDYAEQMWAEQATEDMGTTWELSADGQELRSWLVETADYHIKRAPEFRVVWEALFYPEIRQGLDSDFEREQRDG